MRHYLYNNLKKNRVLSLTVLPKKFYCTILGTTN